MQHYSKGLERDSSQSKILTGFVHIVSVILQREKQKHSPQQKLWSRLWHSSEKTLLPRQFHFFCCFSCYFVLRVACLSYSQQDFFCLSAYIFNSFTSRKQNKVKTKLSRSVLNRSHIEPNPTKKRENKKCIWKNRQGLTVSGTKRVFTAFNCFSLWPWMNHKKQEFKCFWGTNRLKFNMTNKSYITIQEKYLCKFECFYDLYGGPEGPIRITKWKQNSKTKPQIGKAQL